jgi:hypothetical protein
MRASTRHRTTNLRHIIIIIIIIIIATTGDSCRLKHRTGGQN